MPNRPRSRLPKSTASAASVEASLPPIPRLPDAPSITSRRYRLTGSRLLDQRPDLYPAGSPPDRELVDEGEAPAIGHPIPGRIGDEDLVRGAFGHPLEPRRGVGRVADGGVFDPPLGAD